MGRDGRLPFASAIAKVHGKSKTPLVPSLVIGVITILLLVLNVGNQRAFFVLTSVAIIMFSGAYLCVTGPLLIARLRGTWPSAEHGRESGLGRWGLVVNVLAVVFQVGVLVNLASAAGGGLRRRPLVLPVGRVHLHRRARRRGRHLLLRQAARPARPARWPSTRAAPSRRRSAWPTRPPELTRGGGGVHLRPRPGSGRRRLPGLAAAVRRGQRRRAGPGRGRDRDRGQPAGHDDLPAGRRAGGRPAVRVGRARWRVVHDGRVLDLLDPGELFGQASMISGLPTAFGAQGAWPRSATGSPGTWCARYWPARTCCGSWPGRS